MKFKIGDRVKSRKGVTGTIISDTITCADTGFDIQLVRLKKGFWDEDKRFFVSVLASTACNLELIDEEVFSDSHD